MSDCVAVNDHILRARADALYSTILPSAVTGVVGAATIASIMWSGPTMRGAGIFVGFTLAILAIRLIAVLLYRRHGAGNSERWLWAATALIGMSGLAWGGMIFWSTRVASDPQLLVATCIALGAVMITIPTVSFWPAHLAFHVPASLCAAIGFATSGRPGHLRIGIATVVLCAAMAVAGRKLGQEVVRSMRLSAENAALAERLDALSRTDPLTGLANRRGFMDRLDAHWQRSRVGATPVALLAIDVDRFKHYNDAHGHGAGDECLQAVAKALAQGARGTTDLAARPGGEEFALLLPGADAESAARIAERVRKLVEAATRAPASSLPEGVTISIGVAAWSPREGETSRRLLEAADQALYRAKQAGRNRVIVDAGDRHPVPLLRGGIQSR